MKFKKELQEAIENMRSNEGLQATGVVTRVGDGVAWIYGLSDAGANEVVAIETVDGGSTEAFVLNLLEDEIILSLPIVIAHEVCEQALPTSTGEKVSPFDALMALKNK